MTKGQGEALRIDHLSVKLRDRLVLQDIDLSVQTGEWLGIIGPNGSGKSTLLRSILGYLPAERGAVKIFGVPLTQLKPQARARTLAYVQQEAPTMHGFKVKSFLELAYFPLEGAVAPGDWLASCTALCETFHLTSKWNTAIEELSGGEMQRLMLVQSLLQRPEILLLDELTNHLDIYYQLEMMQKLRELPQTKVTALHDLNLALRFCDRVLMLQEGRVFAVGRPTELLNEENIFALYGVRCRLARENGILNYIQWIT